MLAHGTGIRLRLLIDDDPLQAMFLALAHAHQQERRNDDQYDNQSPPQAHGDHRLAMLGAVAGLASREGVEVIGMEAAAVSYPGFEADLAALR